MNLPLAWKRYAVRQRVTGFTMALDIFITIMV